MIKDCAKIFIRRMDTATLTEIFDNSEHLTKILREEAIEKWTKLEILEEELEKLKSAHTAHGLASMHIQKQENANVVVKMEEYQVQVLADTQEKINKMVDEMNIRFNSLNTELVGSFGSFAD